VLLILTLSLSAFTATLAGTLDNHLHDQIYYRIGSDVNFVDLGDSPDDPGMGRAGRRPAQQSSGSGMFTENPKPARLVLPAGDRVLQLPGVQDATRVGRYQATAIFGSRYDSGESWASTATTCPTSPSGAATLPANSLGELMNRLAAQPDGCW
jgi:putative ABC transport system permease protein